MAAFTVNGQTVESGKNQKLLRFLRDELHLTSVKDGCSEGACGACTVIIDGRTCKACVPDTDSLEGKNVITVEGLTDWEEKVYTYAYGKAGAVQCGVLGVGIHGASADQHQQREKGKAGAGDPRRAEPHPGPAARFDLLGAGHGADDADQKGARPAQVAAVQRDHCIQRDGGYYDHPERQGRAAQRWCNGSFQGRSVRL